MSIVIGTRFVRLGLIAGGLLVADGTRADEAFSPPVTSDVLGSLHQAGRKEIQAGEIAQKDGHSKAVKDYGKMLATDHAAAEKKVAALATKEHIDLRASTPAPGANDMGTMASGRDFDKAFAQEMLDDHRKSIAAVTEALNHTEDPQLRKLLTDLLPTLQKHEAAAAKIVDAETNK
jgi:putative membrane protein